MLLALKQKDAAEEIFLETSAQLTPFCCRGSCPKDGFLQHRVLEGFPQVARNQRDAKICSLSSCNLGHGGTASAQSQDRAAKSKKYIADIAASH